jgi:hypothetical protein
VESSEENTSVKCKDAGQSVSDSTFKQTWTDGPALTSWQRFGLTIVRDFMPHDLIDHYVVARGTDAQRWPSDPMPYLEEPTLLDLCCYPPLTALLTDLIGEPPLLHLNLTDFRSTQRKWHQDAYLNPPEVGDYYAAVWFVLDAIHPDAGPFEYVPGSNRWPKGWRLTSEDAKFMATDAQRRDPYFWRDWPSITQESVGEYWQTLINGDLVVPFWPAFKGDVLIWSPWLIHRGSIPIDLNRERRALIAHFSGVNHRSDMPDRMSWNQGEFALNGQKIRGKTLERFQV